MIIYSCLSKKSTLHNLGAPHKWEIMELKENNVHVIHGPTEYSQGVG